MDDSIFFSSVTVNINEVDAHNRLKLNCLLNYLQEAAWTNAGILGFSTYDLLKKDITWVMNRMRIEINACPGHQDEITIETWPSGMDKYFCYRDYRILSKTGEVLVKATSTWVVIDVSSRKLISVPEDIAKSDLNFDRGNLPKVKSKINYLSDKTQYDWPLTASWFDLDLNKHVNNSNYIKWFMDGLPTELVEQHQPTEVDIAFLSEGHVQEDLVVQSYEETPGLFKQRVFSNTKEKALCSAQIRFNNF